MAHQHTIDYLNEIAQERAAEWRRTELPKEREAIFNRGFVRREEILDAVVTVEELLADPHEIWRQAPLGWYWDGWVRVEIEG